MFTFANTNKNHLTQVGFGRMTVCARANEFHCAVGATRGVAVAVLLLLAALQNTQARN